jgi:hypothetical protein
VRAGFDEVRLAASGQRGRDMFLADAVSYALDALEPP